MEGKKIRFVIGCICAGLLATGCIGTSFSTKVVSGGPQTTETRQVGSFSKISLRGAADIEWKPGSKVSVVVEGPANCVKVTLTEVDQDTLVVSQPPETNMRDKVIVRVTSPEITQVNLSGAGDVRVADLKAKSIEINLSGAGNVLLGGSVADSELTVSGAGSIDADSLNTENTTVRVSGAGNAEVNATKTLDATVTGVGNITYAGKPGKVEQKVTGVGHIQAK